MRESPEILGETPRKPGEKQGKRLNLECYAEAETLNKASLNDDEMPVNTSASREEIGSGDKGMSDGDNIVDSTDKCKLCDKVVSNEDSAVFCNGCQFWCHAKCEKLSDKEYDELTKQKSKIKWYCCCCKKESLKPKNIVEKEISNVQIITRNMTTRTREQLPTPTNEKNCNVCETVVVINIGEGNIATIKCQRCWQNEVDTMREFTDSLLVRNEEIGNVQGHDHEAISEDFKKLEEENEKLDQKLMH